jgi:acyl-CoA oxidase
LDLNDIDRGWACVAANVVKKAAEDYARELGKGESKDEAMEKCSQSRFIAAKLHTIGYVSHQGSTRDSQWTKY